MTRAIRSVEEVNNTGVVSIEQSVNDKIPSQDRHTLAEVRELLLKWAARGVSSTQASAELFQAGVQIAKDGGTPARDVVAGVIAGYCLEPTDEFNSAIRGIAWSADSEEQERAELVAWVERAESLLADIRAGMGEVG